MTLRRFHKNLFALTIFLTLSLQIFPQQTPDDVISVESSITILNTLVTDKSGGLRKDLEISDFILEEDGITQKIDFVEAEITPFAAVILLDVSGSMELRVSLARSAAIRFLDGLRPNDSAAVYSFDSSVSIVQDFSHSRDLRSRAFDLKASGNTSLYEAVNKAAEALADRPEKRRAIIVLSDGADTSSGISSSKCLKAAQIANATIYTVDMSAISDTGLRRRQNQGVLKKFASETGGIFVKTPGGIELRNTFANIVEELGVQYTLGYYSLNEAKDGKWRRINLRTTDAEDKVRTRAGYYANPN